MRRAWGGLGASLAAAAWLVACGGEEPAAKAPAKTRPPRQAAASDGGSAALNTAPQLEWVEIEPRDPAPDTRVRAVARATDAEGDRVRFEYRWRVDGRDAGQGDELTLSGAGKGTRVEVVAVASDGRADSGERSAEVQVANRPPRLYAVVLEAPDGVYIGRTLTATPEATDPDGDSVSFRYEWSVNGERRPSDGPSFSLAGLRRGDEVLASVVAGDGEGESDARASDPVKIGNAPPEIVSQPSWSQSGDLYRYALEARDPDGDMTLRYRLKRAPEGMAVDPLEGIVSWQPRADQAGRHAVEVEVDDLQGGKAVQSLEVVIDVAQPAPAQQATQPAQPAAPEPAPAPEGDGEVAQEGGFGDSQPRFGEPEQPGFGEEQPPAQPENAPPARGSY